MVKRVVHRFVASLRYSGLHAAYFKTHGTASINAPRVFVHDHLTALQLPLPSTFFIVGSDFEKADVLCVWAKQRNCGGLEYVDDIRRQVQALRTNTQSLAPLDIAHIKEAPPAPLPPTCVPGVPDNTILGKKRHLRSGYQSALSYPANKKARRELDSAGAQNERPAAIAGPSGSRVKQEEQGTARIPLAPVANVPASTGSSARRVKDEPVDASLPPSSTNAARIQACPASAREASPLDKYIAAINRSAELRALNTIVLRVIERTEAKNRRLRAESQLLLEGLRSGVAHG